MVASSGVVVALRASLFKIYRLIRSEDGFMEDIGGDF
jgi:hypothetical protein